MLRRGRCLAERRGASVVEFALCAPVLFAVLFGTIEFSRMLQIQHTVRQAALEGARAGVAYDAQTTDAQTAATNITATIGIVSPTVTISPNPLSWSSQTITVTVSADPGQNGWLLWFFTAGKPVSATITMAREVQAVSVSSAS
ncbi:MAG TPA: TadE/TadG family type IV pilus assembly protein [Pirellulales bacterium]|jgi:Flp pilus assembly protein TadG|nr:TadE/TadG family type IV pilus assembly protein [Pirellulales bacterium]